MSPAASERRSPAASNTASCSSVRRGKAPSRSNVSSIGPVISQVSLRSAPDRVTLCAMQVGISIIPYTDPLDRNRELVRVADEGGLPFVGIQDHPYQHHFFDTWSLIPTLLAETKRISFFTDVASLPLRPPAVMAKAAASLDVLSGGRFELGLGGGALPELIANFGGPRRTPGQTVEAIEEAIDLIRLMWSDERSVSYEGKHYRLND